MAVSKTPRKKPVPAVVDEEKPAPKAKVASARKAAPKLEEPAALKAKAVKAPAKSKAAKAAAAPEPSESLPEAVIPAPSQPAPAPKKAPVVPALTPLAQTILTAICEGRAVEFIFADADANAPRTFEPRQLAFDALSLAWYVWGWDRRYNAERYHRVDLLAEVNDVEGVGRAAQGPYAEGTPDRKSVV